MGSQVSGRLARAGGVDEGCLVNSALGPTVGTAGKEDILNYFSSTRMVAKKPSSFWALKERAQPRSLELQFYP